LVSTLFLLGGLAWITVRAVLPRFGVRAPDWVNSVCGGIFIASGLALIVLSYLLPRAKQNL
jgi:hypothetical protein